MPITRYLRSDLELIVSVHVGAVPDAEFIEAYREMYADPDFDLSFDRLIDLRDADSSVRSPEALRAVADILDRLFRGTELAPRTAVIAPSDVSFGLGRMYDAFSVLTAGTFVVFKSAEAALAWLQVPPDALADILETTGRFAAEP